MNSKIVIPFLLFLFTLLVYLHHLSPSVYGGDVGDFLVAIERVTIAHPSGYPLFVLLGILFKHLLFFTNNLAWKVGMISALASSLAVVCLYRISYLLSKNHLVSVLSALVLAFVYTFWLYAEVAEVFALNTFAMLGLLLLGMTYYYNPQKKYFYLLTFFSGLSLTNHEIVVFLGPTLLLLLVAKGIKKLLQVKTIVLGILFFLLGLTPYIYIPLVSHNISPVWGVRETLTDVFHHIMRSDYGWQPNRTQGIDIRLLSLKTYAFYVFKELTPPVTLLSFIGFWALVKKRQYVLALALLLLVFVSGPLTILYVNTQIFTDFAFGVLERFYMLSMVFSIVFLPIGILAVRDILLSLVARVGIKQTKRFQTLFLLPFFLLPFLLFLHNFSRTDLHDIWVGDYIGKDLLLSLPPNSVVFMTGDSIVFNALYMQDVYDIRPDVSVVNLGTFDRNPTFVKEREKIVKDKTIPKEQIPFKTILSLSKTRPVFSSTLLSFNKEDRKDVIWVPYGLVLQLSYQKPAPAHALFVEKNKRVWSEFEYIQKRPAKLSDGGLTISHLSAYYSDAALNAARFLISEYDDYETAKQYYDKAVVIKPDSSVAHLGLAYYHLSFFDCKKAEEHSKKVMTINPGDKKAYLILYSTYDVCYKDPKKASSVAKTFSELFREPIIEYIKEELKEE